MCAIYSHSLESGEFGQNLANLVELATTQITIGNQCAQWHCSTPSGITTSLQNDLEGATVAKLALISIRMD